MSSPSTDPYKILGVDCDADISAIKTAYRKLVLKCHPDKVQDPTLKAIKQDEFQRVQQAYEILSDEPKRKKYDEEATFRRQHDEYLRNPLRPSGAATTARASTKVYAEFNVRTAEPPPGFKPGPPPTSPYASYASGAAQFAHSWDHDMPHRSKAMYDENRRARRAASYEKPRDESREERKRRKDEDETHARDLMRDKEREKDRDRKNRSDREREEKRDRQRRDQEKHEKERERPRRSDQPEKPHGRRVYVEPYGTGEEQQPPPKTKSPASGSNNKKYVDSPRRDKPLRDESPHVDPSLDKTSEKMKYAADYMDNARRRGSKSSTSASHPPEGVAYSPSYPDPDSWQGPSNATRPRYSAQDEKFRARATATEDEVDSFMKSSEARPPRLTKAYTSPAGFRMPNSSAQRMPASLDRSATMDSSRRAPPAAPAAPAAEPGRHLSTKSERRHRNTTTYNDESRPRRSTRSYQPDDFPPFSRSAKHSHYRPSDDYHTPPLTTGATFERVKTTPGFEQVYQAKRYSDDDVIFSTVNHSSDQYSSSHPHFLNV